MSQYRITYIYHDCFLLETEKAVVLFDYWKDPLNKGLKDFPPFLDDIDCRKPFYVLVSHHHKDHFSRRIFFWHRLFKNIRYIISSDCFKAVRYMFKENSTYTGEKPPLSSIHVLKEGDVYEDETVRISAFGSTDIGNSYVVGIDGRNYFHAGDLNAWIWKDESSTEEVEEALRLYQEKLDAISREFNEFDVAMFPVDSRLGTDYFLGASIFVRTFDVKLFLPMHFELVDNPDDKTARRLDTTRFNLYANPSRGSYLALTASRDSYFHRDN